MISQQANPVAPLLSRIQIETTLMQIDKELRDAKVRLSLASRRENEIHRMTPFEIQMNILKILLKRKHED